MTERTIESILDQAIKSVAQLRCCPTKPCPIDDRTCACFSPRNSEWEAMAMLRDEIKSREPDEAAARRFEQRLKHML